MIFETKVAGVRCYCEVTLYAAEEPMVITGSGMGDCEPGEDEEFEFIIRGIEGQRRMKALEERITQSERNRLLKEYKAKLLDF